MVHAAPAGARQGPHGPWLFPRQEVQHGKIAFARVVVEGEHALACPDFGGLLLDCLQRRADEFRLIESSSSRAAGLREATIGYVDFLTEMATIR